MKLRLFNIALFFALSGSAATLAAEQGGFIGLSGSTTSTGNVYDAYAADGLITNSIIDVTDQGWKLFAGFRFNQNLALEGSYTDFGKSFAHSIVSASLSRNGNLSQPSVSKAWELAAVGTLPLPHRFDLYGKAGFHHWNAQWNNSAPFSGVGDLSFESLTGTNLMYGIGAGFNFSTNFALRAEWELLKSIDERNVTNEPDVELWSAGVQYNF